MFCESYREALNKAAVSDEQLPADVQAHLAACASCRESFSEEKALFGLIEAGLRTRASAEMPASLLPRVRQEIAASTAAQTWRVPVLASVASGLAIGAIALSFAVRTKVSSVKPEPPASRVSSAISSESSSVQKQSGSEQMAVATSRSARRRVPLAIPNPEPEVLISAEEQLGLQRYAASLKLRNTKAQAAVLKGNAAPEIEPLQIASVDVKRLSIEPLEDSDSN
jgi:hypothetical protein